jgi:hypothetical protein
MIGNTGITHEEPISLFCDETAYTCSFLIKALEVKGANLLMVFHCRDILKEVQLGTSFLKFEYIGMI